MYKLENMGDTQITKDHKLIEGIYLIPGLANRRNDINTAIETVLAEQAQKQRSIGQTIDAIINILDPAGQAARELEAAKRQAETQADIDAGRSGGRRSKKRPSARRRRSSKRKARKSRSTRRR